MKVIIIEDETLAFNKLSKYLLDYRSDAQIIAWFSSIEDALLEKHLFDQCDLVLSDIKILDGDSFELFNQIKLNSPIIFCTAYNQYMQDAFDSNGIAYLVKPYSQKAFEQAMLKFEQFFDKKDTFQLDHKALHVIEQFFQKNNKTFKQRFSIKKKDGIIIKMTADTLFFQASGDFCLLIDKHGERHTINYKISNLEKILNPISFFRINRSEIVNINFIKKIEPYFKNKMQIVLSNQAILHTSGARTPEFRKWLDGE